MSEVFSVFICLSVFYPCYLLDLIAQFGRASGVDPLQNSILLERAVSISQGDERYTEVVMRRSVISFIPDCRLVGLNRLGVAA